MDANVLAALIVAIPAVASIVIAAMKLHSGQEKIEKKVEDVHVIVNGRTDALVQKLVEAQKEIQYLTDMLNHRDGTL